MCQLRHKFPPENNKLHRYLTLLLLVYEGRSMIMMLLLFLLLGLKMMTKRRSVMVMVMICSNRRNARRGVTNVRITICDRHRSLAAPGGPLLYFYYFDYLLIISSIEISPSS